MAVVCGVNGTTLKQVKHVFTLSLSAVILERSQEGFLGGIRKGFEGGATFLAYITIKLMFKRNTVFLVI